MFIGKVVGTVVSSVKDPKVAALKFQIVQELDEQNRPRSKYIVAVDTVGAGQGDLVLFAQGSSARQSTLALRDPFVPIDATIVGHVEQFEHEPPAAPGLARAGRA